MGQRIVVQQPVVDGDVAVFVTNRNFSGADGVRFDSATVAGTGTSVPAELAARLFGVDPGMRHVYVAANHIVVRRVVGWDDAHVDEAVRVVEDFFVFYPAADST
jgi:hypothetical protein